MCVLSGVLLFASPWTVALRAPLSMEFPRQEYWNGLLFPCRGDLPDQVIKLTSLVSSALAGRFFITGAMRETLKICGKSGSQSDLFILVLINVPDSCTRKLKKKYGYEISGGVPNQLFSVLPISSCLLLKMIMEII